MVSKGLSNIFSLAELPPDYINVDKEIRLEMCRNVLKQVLQKIQFSSSVKDRIMYMDKTLAKLELECVDDELYEYAAFFNDIRRILHEEVLP